MTEKVKLSSGQTIIKVHDKKLCEGRNCSIHNPSNHPLKDAPQAWRNDRSLMERICVHGVGHPDPDHISFVASTDEKAAQILSVHGCCGCCSPNKREE